MEVAMLHKLISVALILLGMTSAATRPHLTRLLNRRYCMSADGQRYPAGARYQPDACTRCHCPSHGGRPRCSVQDCYHDVTCVRWKEDPTSCCGTCQESGCRHRDGSVHTRGSLVLDSPCEKCLCPQTGGRTVCEIKKTCTNIRCVDPVISPGSCCPFCPHGSSCWYGNRILRGDERVMVGECRVCGCLGGEAVERSIPWAVCTDLPKPCSLAP